VRIHGYTISKNSDGTFSVMTETGIATFKRFASAVAHILIKHRR